MQKFKIFYSWQSDLPGNKSRNFICECIDEAIDLAQESEAIEAERDEATTGMTGSPDIVTTLFSKIDDCDLFVADLAYVLLRIRKKKRPKPNVLLELGYAVKTLGWERVICLCNTDYGDKYPFDIAHNRITGFSLEGKSKKEVKGDIAKIIFINIRDIRKQPPRAKSGVATHIVGTYDFENRKVTSVLTTIEISNQESYVLHNKLLQDEASELITEILELTNGIRKTEVEQNSPQMMSPDRCVSSVDIQPELSDVVRAMAESYKASEIPVVWEDVEENRERIKRWIGMDVPDEFFHLGGLK